jgi:hypothetical protein
MIRLRIRILRSASRDCMLGNTYWSCEQVEVISSFAVSSFGLRVTPEKTFNHFILRDGEQHAAWPLNFTGSSVHQTVLNARTERRNRTRKYWDTVTRGRVTSSILISSVSIRPGKKISIGLPSPLVLKLSQCADVDAASFKALSEEYTKDKNKVYYKWISSGRFWVVELPLADAKSFEVIGSNLAKTRSMFGGTVNLYQESIRRL